MKVLVLNGSPKGNNSVTVQTSKYLAAKFTDDEFEIINVGQKIRKYQRDFSEIEVAIEKADLILFSYPVYTFVATYQLHRFIEVMKSKNLDLSKKFAAQISTSKHFYDTTANKYVQENCNDMNMKYVGVLSADMDDLLCKKGQRQATEFWEYVRYCVKENFYENPITGPKQVYTKYDRQFNQIIAKSDSKKITIVTTCKDDPDLQNMIDDFRAIMPFETKVVNLNECRIDGGCLGCFSCAQTAKCIYKDGFDSFLREQIQTSDAIVYAFKIQDHSMGPLFKMYHDRQFCNGHRTVTVGMPIGYIINGNLNYEANLRMIIEGRADVGETPLTHIAYDSNNMANEIRALAHKLTWHLEKNISPRRTFLGIGGMKIFRDLIYIMQGMMKADHKFYKANGHYDFPQKEKGMILKMKLVGALMAMPNADKVIKGQMNKAIVMPYDKVIDKAKADAEK